MPTLDEVREHFKAAGVAGQKWPEELHQVDDYPRTASGKVQKFRVRKDFEAVIAGWCVRTSLPLRRKPCYRGTRRIGFS